MNNDVLLIAPNPTTTAAAAAASESASLAENLGGAVEILFQGMASIFVVLGVIALVVAVLKKMDSKKK